MWILKKVDNSVIECAESNGQSLRRCMQGRSRHFGWMDGEGEGMEARGKQVDQGWSVKKRKCK